MRGHLLPIAFGIPLLIIACENMPESPVPDTSAPVVWITAPSDSSTLAVADTIHVSATDDEGVARVAVYVDGDSLGEDAAAPYMVPFDPFGISADTLVVHAHAWDASGTMGVSSTTTLFIPSPALLIEAPAEGEVLSGLVSVQIDAFRPELVTEIQLQVDGVGVGEPGPPPFLVNWETEPWSDGGLHQLRAVGLDVDGLPLSSDPVNVRIAPGSEAVPSLLSPDHDSVHFMSDVSFIWMDEPWASSYQIEVATTSSFDEIILSEECADSFATYPITGSGWRYWRVRAGFTDLGWSNWSLRRQFQLALPLNEDGVCSALVSTKGRHGTFDAEGNLLIVGEYEDAALALGLDADGDPYLFTPLLQDIAPAAAQQVVARSGGGWSLFCGGGTGGLVLDIDNEGYELMRRPMPEGEYYDHCTGMMALEQNAVAVQVDNRSGYTASSLARLDTQGDIDWSLDFYGMGDGGHWGYNWTTHSGAGLILSSGDLIHLIQYEHRWASFDDIYGDQSGGAQYGFIQEIDPSTGGEIRESVHLASESLDAFCVDPAAGYCAIGMHSDEYPALFLVSNDLEASFSAALGAFGDGLELKFHAMVAIDSGDFVVVGKSGTEALIFRALADGTVIWQRELGHMDFEDVFNHVLLDDDGTLITIGTTRSPLGHHSALWLNRFDTAGNELEW